MLALIRRNKLFFVLFTALALVLRGYFLHWHFLFEGDSLVYGELAKNWLLHGVYGLREAGRVFPVDIRMPGYPAFLAVSFRLFGIEHYGAIVRIQALLDLLTCFVTAAGARRLWSDGAAKIAFALAALCPFTANYCATPLPETLSIFAAALALLFALRAVQTQRTLPSWDVAHSFAVADWSFCGLAIALSIYLRPDGGVLLIATGLCLLWFWVSERDSQFFWSGVLVAATSLVPLAPWTVRNWRTLHQFEPLAPFYAQLPNEYVARGFDRWCKTWVIDFYSVANVEWNVSTETDGEAVDLKDIPARAYDDGEQMLVTRQLFTEYNESLRLTPEMDHRFAQLAAERIRSHPFRFYVGLPLLRLSDMWFRPRTEMLNLQLDWWNWQDVPQESTISALLALLDIFYVLTTFWTLRRRMAGSAVLWLFLLCRSVLLATLPNPEPRYTLECFPALMMLAGAGLAPKFRPSPIR
jgi:hypothetical protein